MQKYIELVLLNIQAKGLIARKLQHLKKFALSHTWKTTWCIETMALSLDGAILAYSRFDDWTFDDSGISVYDLNNLIPSILYSKSRSANALDILG